MFGIVVGGKKPLPHHGTKIAEHDEWIVVLGGSGTVGQYAIQVWTREPIRSKTMLTTSRLVASADTR